MKKILIAESVDIKFAKVMAANKNVCFYDGLYKGGSSGDINFYYTPDITPDQIEYVIKDYDALIVRPKEVTAKAIYNADNLKLIIRGGAGVNTIAVAEAKAKNIIVENTPGKNSISTAEYAFALIMELVGKRNILISNSKGRLGDPGLPDDFSGFELAGKKIAIIGLGNIGMALAKRCEAFDMDVIAFSRSRKNIGVQQYDSLHKLLEQKADIVSLNIPLTDATKNIIGEKEFSLMKKGTILINTARPALVDTKAFALALENGIIASAGIDGDYPLIKPFIEADKNNKCLITHHIADATYEAQQKITEQLLKQVFAFFEDGKVVNGV